jgi:hypothetical protein
VFFPLNLEVLLPNHRHSVYFLPSFSL